MLDRHVAANNRPRGVGTSDPTLSQLVTEQPKHVSTAPSETSGEAPLGAFQPPNVSPCSGRPTHRCDERCRLTPEQAAEREAERERQLREITAWGEPA